MPHLAPVPPARPGRHPQAGVQCPEDTSCKVAGRPFGSHRCHRQASSPGVPVPRCPLQPVCRPLCPGCGGVTDRRGAERCACTPSREGAPRHATAAGEGSRWDGAAHPTPPPRSRRAGSPWAPSALQHFGCPGGHPQSRPAGWPLPTRSYTTGTGAAAAASHRDGQEKGSPAGVPPLPCPIPSAPRPLSPLPPIICPLCPSSSVPSAPHPPSPQLPIVCPLCPPLSVPSAPHPLSPLPPIVCPISSPSSRAPAPGAEASNRGLCGEFNDVTIIIGRG